MKKVFSVILTTLLLTACNIDIDDNTPVLLTLNLPFFRQANKVC